MTQVSTEATEIRLPPDAYRLAVAADDADRGAWILVLLLGGGLALDRSLTALVTRNFDDQLDYMLTAMIASAEIGPDGEVFFNRPLGDQRFLEPNSGLYWQISGQGHEDFPSRSLWDRSLAVRPITSMRRRTSTTATSLPAKACGSSNGRSFCRAATRSGGSPSPPARDELDAQISRIRAILFYSFAILGLGLFVMAALQTYYGLCPLRRVRRAIQRDAAAGVRTG